ncbi:MAG TPA: glycine zipper domain-containing protein [Candidatus Omnitrophota bacterium]|nr:glycine zipper domain-containing protein [Candidatus Omnitrophota bacterium]HQL41790.1 glycine zipper domain-containing protein [Candidatus Omnitrophota bacterium]
MRSKIIVTVAVLASFALIGCESMGSNTKKGIGIGGVLGAVAGGVVGHQTGHGVEGALIGGAVGAGAGGLIGSGMDDQSNPETPSTESASHQLTILKVVDMSREGTPDDVIIDQIQKTGSVFVMDEQTVQYLKDNKVSEKVIGYMLSTKR